MTADLLLAALQTHAGLTPCKPFLLFGCRQRWTQFSFGDALRETERWARHWAALSLPDAAVVCIALPHSAEAYFLFLGAMRAGLVPAFLAFPTPKQQSGIYWSGLRGLLDRTVPACMVVEPDELSAVKVIAPKRCVVLTLEAMTAASGPLAAQQDDPAGLRLALVQHSSGTTGAKKGVALTFDQIRLQVEAYSKALDIGPRDRIVSWLPLYHDMGLITGFLLPLTLGATVVSIDAFEWVAKPDLLFEAIELVSATLAWLPNFAFAHLVRVKEPGRHFALGSMRAFVNCSEPCKPATAAAFAAAFKSSGIRPDMLLTCYAMAETVFAVTQSRPGFPPPVLQVALQPLQQAGVVGPPRNGQAMVELLSCGTPVEGVDIAIRHADGWVHRDNGRVGEIVVRSTFLFGGYYRNAVNTATAFDDPWFRTGDLGFMHDGQLYVTGRLKDVIIVHGRNFYAHDIEEAVGEVPGIKPGRAVAFAQSDSRSASEEVVVAAETGIEDQATLDALRRAVRKHVFDRLELSLHHIKLCRPGTLVKTTSGKISRDENARRLLARAGTMAGEPVHG